MENKSFSVTATVEETMTAKNVKSGSLRVLATPVLAALCEQAACGCVAELLPEGKTSVGTELTLRHVAATPVGMRVNVIATLLESEGRELRFSLRAEDEAGLIGEGEHTRFLVDAERFQQKADAKGETLHGN